MEVGDVMAKITPIQYKVHVEDNCHEQITRLGKAAFCLWKMGVPAFRVVYGVDWP